LTSLPDRIQAVREEKDTTKRFQLLQELNDSLPPDKRMKFPSLITNAYIRGALDSIEESLSSRA
jgi:hypothetical protein